MPLWISDTQPTRSFACFFIFFEYCEFWIVPSTRSMPAAAHPLPCEDQRQEAKLSGGCMRARIRLPVVQWPLSVLLPVICLHIPPASSSTRAWRYNRHWSYASCSIV